MKIMATWMTLKQFDGADTRWEYKGRDDQSLVRQFKYRQPFGLYFFYRHQVDYHNSRRHAPLSIERTLATTLWPDGNFTCYLAITEVNTALTDGHFLKGGKLIPTLKFHRKFAHDMMENKIGVDTVDCGIPRSSTFTPAISPCELQKVKKHEGSYNKMTKNSKKSSRNIKNRDARTLKLATNGLEVFVNATWASFCEMDVSFNTKLRL